MQNPSGKHHMTFVKVGKGGEIYNFPIHHLVHFYSNFWSFKRSNRCTMTQSRASRCHVATSRALPPRHPSLARAFPRHPAPSWGPWSPRPLTCRFRTRRRPRHYWIAGPPAAPSPVRLRLPRLPPYHDEMPSVSSTRSKRPAAYKSESQSSRVPSRPVLLRRRPPSPPLGELRLLLHPRSTDPSGTPSMLRRGSSRHPSPRIAPLLIGMQATVAAARVRRRWPSSAASPPRPTSLIEPRWPPGRPPPVPGRPHPPDRRSSGKPRRLTPPRTILQDFNSFRGPICKLRAYL
jgi:hypothetical protein